MEVDLSTEKEKIDLEDNELEDNEPFITLFTSAGEIKEAFNTEGYPLLGDIVYMLKEIETKIKPEESFYMKMYTLSEDEYNAIENIENIEQGNL
jgi:hypothetical protein